jgi:hypothetical protein
MRAAVQHHKLSPFLSMPHKKRKNERLPEYNVLLLFSKLLALTLAYEIVVEEYSAQFFGMISARKQWTGCKEPDKLHSICEQ